MSDEIDIEEHDVMDNPTIKRIFPDLSMIKKEINQYYDEDLNAPPETTPEKSSQGDEITRDSEAQPSKHIQNSNELVTTRPLHAAEATETQKASRYLHENIIILGSKPNNGMIKEPKLILKNVDSFLNRCRRYCKECLILFPKAHLFNIHLINIHIKRNKQTAFMGRKLADKLYKCNVCDKSLSSQPHLSRHFRNLHRDIKTLKTVDRSDKKIVTNEASHGKVTSGLSCFHCQQLFPTQSSLIEHLYEVLEPTKNGSSDKCTRSTSTKEIYREDNFDDRLTEDECAKDLNESNQSSRNNLVVNSSHSKLDTNNGNSESTLPRKKNPKRGSLVVGLVEYGNENVKKKKHVANRNPLQNANTNARMRLKTKKCNDCAEQFNSVRELEYHVKSLHQKRSNNKNKFKSKLRKETSKFKFKKPSQSMFYKCFICSKYNVTFEFYSRHIKTDHNIKKVSEVNKVPFDSQCKFCPSKPSGIYSYNVHLYKYHKKQLKGVNFLRKEQPVNKNQEKLEEKIQLALKNILYKCMKCDLFFFSSNAAMDHSKHLGISDTWKCSVCQRVFKSENMALHEKQHSFSETFTVHTLTESAVSRVLYKCSNCTVHYSEENFLLHYLKCDSETPNSLYCKVCDILINRDDMEYHGVNHKERNMQYCDFIIIESDMIDDRHTSPNTAKAKNDIANKYEKTDKRSDENSKLVMSFCQTCKCFISNINLTRKVHKEGRCGHMLKTVCKDCGLMLTMKTHSTHKQHHKKQQISLHDYLFFDLTYKKRICPPIPDYPKCNSCGVHFLRNYAIKIHSCQEQDYVTCNICSIKLTEHAYKLHMPFHSYSIKGLNTNLEDTVLQPNPANEISNVRTNSNVSDDPSFKDVMIFYTCKSCQLTVNTYDRVVQHCQDHYDSKEVQLNTQKCQNCILILHRSDYKSHNMLHINGKYNKDSIKVVDFDPFYFRFNNGFWTKHIFAYLSDEEITKILSTSIYRYECRLKMEEIQSGSSSLILYKCDKCQVFIDPYSLYIHAVNSRDKSCVKLRKHPCALCGLNFISLAYRIAHEKKHESIDMNLKLYKIVLYNKEEHESYNKIMHDASNRYILYQCRNCERVVDKFERNAHKCDENNLKICSICGLLLDKQDFDLHFIRHEELDKFNAENIIVVMFGKLCYLGRKKLRSTFSGVKYDYTIYKCKKCDLCLRTKKSKSDHVCIYENSKCKCSKCGLYFSKLELKSHNRVHESNLDFDDLNMNIITFDTSSANPYANPKDKLVDNNTLNQEEEAKERNSIVIGNSSTSSEKQEIIYKCDCGLHFLEELNAQEHANICNARMKISKQSCIKCDLLFTPGELFNHLLKHHCDKKIKIKFDIVTVFKIEKEKKVGQDK